jgi:hypothetical protein
MDLNPQQIQQMIQLLQSMLPNEQQHTEEASTPTVQSPIKTNNRRRPQDSAHTNLFDTMTESRLHKDDCKIDKLLAVNEPTPRTRQFKSINVRCRVCGRQENINPMLLTDSSDRYKCNQCSRSAG